MGRTEHKIIYYGRARQGKFLPHHPNFVTQRLLEMEGEEIGVTIEKRLNIRTLPQNAYMHVVISYIAEETGYTLEETKEKMKFMFLLRTDEDGLSYVPSTATLTTVQMTTFIDEMKAWASEFLHLYIPDAEEVE